MARRKHNPFDDLPDEWKTGIEQSTVEDINKSIVELSVAEVENQQAKAGDLDLKEKKEAVKWAAEGYRENTKSYKAKMKFILMILEGKGKA